jgi:hypothetical protein
LHELDVALARFAAKALEALDAVDPEIQRRLDFLEERSQYWMDEVQECQRVYEEADDEERSDASYKLEEAKEELRRIRHYQKRVEEYYRNYRRETEQLRELCTRHTATARAFLQRKLAELNTYVAAQPSDASDSTSTVTSSSISKSEAPIIEGFEQSSTLSSEDVQYYVKEQIPLAHLNALARVVYADSYKHDNSAYVVGEYNHITGTIIIYKQSPNVDDLSLEMKLTITHEIGHNVYFNVVDSAARAEWKHLSRSSRRYVTSYAGENDVEDFAESYATYILDPERLKATNPEKYVFLCDRVFHGKEYV